MIRRLSLLLITTFFLLNCGTKNDANSVYELILVCFEDFYERKGVNISDEMDTFEKHLHDEGHLTKNSSGYDYIKLLTYLENNIYFSNPLRKDDFNQILLHENPSNLTECLNYSFDIDSVEFMNLNYYRATQRIGEIIEEREEIGIEEMFNVYATLIPQEEFNLPFVRESILLFLYRWYFQSKFDRQIPIPLDALEELD